MKKIDDLFVESMEDNATEALSLSKVNMNFLEEVIADLMSNKEVKDSSTIDELKKILTPAVIADAVKARLNRNKELLEKYKDALASHITKELKA